MKENSTFSKLKDKYNDAWLQYQIFEKETMTTMKNGKPVVEITHDNLKEYIELKADIKTTETALHEYVKSIQK